MVYRPFGGKSLCVAGLVACVRVLAHCEQARTTARSCLPSAEAAHVVSKDGPEHLDHLRVVIVWLRTENFHGQEAAVRV